MGLLRIAVLLLVGCATARPPRGVVLVIGDGMGPGQVALLLRARPHGALAQMMRDGEIGLVDPTPFGALVTDSAAGGTALATGVQTRPRMLAVDPDGRRVATLVEVAAHAGRATGVVTTADLTDATPAAFLSHVVDRGDAKAIAAQEAAAPPTIAIGGGAQWFAHPPPAIHALAAGDLPYRGHGARPPLARLAGDALAALTPARAGFVL
ncbi:MAG TPA: alkaline phosphatase, partial [Kofleriaceae bacterium]|nr:alkaline phosphatase [Kofleriaceae bacterium]